MESRITSDGYLLTGDLALASSLRAYGHEPIKLELNGHKNAYWMFDSDACEEEFRQYQAGTLMVEPRRYNSVLRKTRGELFDFLRGHGLKPINKRV